MAQGMESPPEFISQQPSAAASGGLHSSDGYPRPNRLCNWSSPDAAPPEMTNQSPPSVCDEKVNGFRPRCWGLVPAWLRSRRFVFMWGASPMNPFFYREGAGAKGLPPLSPAPPIPAEPASASLRTLSGLIHLTIPNTWSTITMSASLRSDCCSPSHRNAVRLPSGMGVQLHRNPQ